RTALTGVPSGARIESGTPKNARKYRLAVSRSMSSPPVGPGVPERSPSSVLCVMAPSCRTALTRAGARPRGRRRDRQPPAGSAVETAEPDRGCRSRALHQQVSASYGATTRVPSTTTAASPASTCADRVLNDWYAARPGATPATSRVPNGVSSTTSSGASPSLSARTVTYAVPARHRVVAVAVTGTSRTGTPPTLISAAPPNSFPAIELRPTSRRYRPVPVRSTVWGASVAVNDPVATGSPHSTPSAET